MIERPAELDAVACTNLADDILSDEASAVARGVGLAPGANLNSDRQFPSMFGPIHGSAPDIGGRGIANPIAAILVGAMLLRHVGNGDAATDGAAEAIERAVGDDLASGRIRTRGLGGDATTAAVGEADCATIDHRPSVGSTSPLIWASDVREALGALQCICPVFSCVEDVERVVPGGCR